MDALNNTVDSAPTISKLLTPPSRALLANLHLHISIAYRTSHVVQEAQPTPVNRVNDPHPHGHYDMM